MENLDKDFWCMAQRKYVESCRKFIFWLPENSMMPMSWHHFTTCPAPIQFGLFMQYTMEHERKRDWFRAMSKGDVATQIEWWFTLEERELVDGKRQVMPTYL